MKHHEIIFNRKRLSNKLDTLESLVLNLSGESLCEDPAKEINPEDVSLKDFLDTEANLIQNLTIRISSVIDNLENILGKEEKIIEKTNAI